MLNLRPNENKKITCAIHDRKKNLTDHKHLNQDGALGAHLLDHIDPFCVHASATFRKLTC